MDSLENRHLRGVGDLLLRSVRPALLQIARSVRGRLELKDESEVCAPTELIDSRPLVNAINKFFTANPLVQYLDQQNPLSELSHRRRLLLLDQVVSNANSGTGRNERCTSQSNWPCLFN